MAVTGTEGQTKVLFVPQSVGIADPDGPTVAELTDAEVTDISHLITRDGLQRPEGSNMVDTASITNTHDVTAPGTTSGTLTLKFLLHTQDGTEDNTAWELFADQRGTVGSIVIRGEMPWTTAIANGQEVEVYHDCIIDTAFKQSPAANTAATASVQLHTQSDPVRRAVVGSGS